MNKDIVLITGGDGYIAKRMVQKYLDNGCKVIAADVREKSDEENFNKNENYEYYKVDVTNVEDLQELYRKIEQKYGRITHLISAAGTTMPTEKGKVDDVTFEDIEKSISLNLTSHIYITKIFLPLLKREETSKSIILISSVNAMKTFNLPIYSAAKAGIYGFMKSIVKETGKENIRINVISPGTVPTPENLEIYNSRYKHMLALKDFTRPEDIADAAFSLTHIMNAVTGQNLVVDSGQIS